MPDQMLQLPSAIRLKDSIEWHDPNVNKAHYLNIDLKNYSCILQSSRTAMANMVIIGNDIYVLRSHITTKMS